MPRGSAKLNWHNLLQQRCPKCAQALREGGETARGEWLLQCSNARCSFVITQRKHDEIYRQIETERLYRDH